MILLVDDSKVMRMLCSRVARGMGLTVHEAENGKDALALLEEHPEIDLVLLDWNMPVMDGLTCLQQIRQSTRIHQPTVVMCTTEGEQTHIQRALQAGADEYIMKPFTDDILRGKLREAELL